MSKGQFLKRLAPRRHGPRGPVFPEFTAETCDGLAIPWWGHLVPNEQGTMSYYGDGLQHAWIGQTPDFKDVQKSFCGQSEPMGSEFGASGTTLWWSQKKKTGRPARLECKKCRVEVDKFKSLWLSRKKPAAAP